MPKAIIKKFQDKYGKKRGKSIYFATANKQGRDPETFKKEDMGLIPFRQWLNEFDCTTDIDKLINESESADSADIVAKRNAIKGTPQEQEFMELQKKFLTKLGSTFTPVRQLKDIVAEWSPKFRQLYFGGKIDEINKFMEIPINDVLARIQGRIKLNTSLDANAAQQAVIFDLMPSLKAQL
jgi:hypothetical protein